MNLWWQCVDKTKRGKPTRYVLFAGVLDAELAALDIANGGVHWHLTVLLPQTLPAMHGPFNKQRLLAERVVRTWFDLANTARPAADAENRIGVIDAD